jgi:hypothetical protein
MARYTCSFLLSTPIEQLEGLLHKALDACQLNIIHRSDDYWMALEIPGTVSYTQLVTVEVLIESTLKLHDAETRLHFIIKNEELPIRANNHCRQVSEQLSQVLQASDRFCPLSNVTG